jgi:Protein of unknown function (DUF1579)
MRKALQLLAVACVVAIWQAASTAQEAPKPSAEHQRLAYFVGKWTSVGEVKPSPMGPGGQFTTTDTCEWFEGRFAVVCRGEGKTPTGPMKNLALMSYSAEEKVYTYYAVDNSGMTMASVVKGTVKGDTWTYTDETVMGGQKIKMQVTVREVSPTEYTFRMEVQSPDGKLVPIMEAKNTKMK